jgi:hypothetical protein
MSAMERGCPITVLMLPMPSQSLCSESRDLPQSDR